ncbi:MAG: terminase large subunit domain-containing protein [Aggregatilineales bacterium]
MVRLIRPHPGQETILRSEARFRVVACGRRFGKTEIGKIALLERAVRGGRCWWLAPTYGMAAQVWRDLRAACASVGGVRASERERWLDLPGGGLIAVRSAHRPDLLRGMGLDFAVLDEAAFMTPNVWPQIVRPMLLERQGGALFLSSPNGRNWFYELFALAQSGAPGWVAFHFTSYDNPLIPRAELDAIRRATPERVWREEYLAEFMVESGQVFRDVQAAAAAPLRAAPQPGAVYSAGVDWGRDNDFTAVAVIDAGVRQMVALDRFTGLPWALQRGRLAALCARWRPAAVWAEINSIGSPNVEALQAEGLPVRPFYTSAASKGPLIEGLALAIERGDLALLPDETLLAELAAYRAERLPGGGYRYNAPPGGHDDCVIALALAWHGARFGGACVDFA